jgi:hypothetical protein
MAIHFNHTILSAHDSKGLGNFPGRDVEPSSPEALGAISDGRHRKRGQSRLHLSKITQRPPELAPSGEIGGSWSVPPAA